MVRDRFSGCFDLRLSQLRRDLRAAQQDKLETFFEEIDFPELWKSNWPITHRPIFVKRSGKFARIAA